MVQTRGRKLMWVYNERSCHVENLEDFIRGSGGVKGKNPHFDFPRESSTELHMIMIMVPWRRSP
jgi:hypothetical protein